MPASAIQKTANGLILRIHLQPRASKDEVTGLYGDALKIRITTPPVDGKANQHLIHFLAKCFAVPRNQVCLLSGESSRDKRIQITSPNNTPDWLDKYS